MVLHAAKHTDPSVSVAATGKASGSYSRTVTTAPHQRWCGRLRMCLSRGCASTKWLQLQGDEVPLNPTSPEMHAALIQMIRYLPCHHLLHFRVICFRHLTGVTAACFQNRCDQSQPKGPWAAGYLQRVEV